MTREELQGVRKTHSVAMKHRDLSGKDVYVIVSMGTAGIASGAKQIVDAFLEEVDEKCLTNVAVTQTGSLECDKLPAVKVLTEKGETLYGEVDKALVKRIVSEHIVGGKPVSDRAVEK